MSFRSLLIIHYSLLIVLASCTRNDRWSLQTMRTGNAAFDSSKLSCMCQDKVNGLDLEILSTAERTRMALVAHSHPIAPYALDEKKALVKISGPKKQLVVLGTRREGGQRVVLPAEVYPFILETLKNGLPLTFQVPGYKSRVEPGAFASHLEKMRHPPYELIIHLPL